MNTPNDFMVEMGRLFGTGRGGQMVQNEQLALQQQHQQMLEEQARRSAVQQWMMSDPKNIPEIQQSVMGGQTIRANDQTYNYNDQIQPLQIEQQKLVNQGQQIHNSGQEFGLNRDRAGEMVNGDPFGMTHAKQGAELMAIHDAEKKQKDAQAASAVLSVATMGLGGLGGLLGGAGGAAGEAAGGGGAASSGTGLGGLLSTPGKNGDGVAQQGIPPAPEAMTLETATSPTLPGEGNPFANPTGLSMLQNFLATKTGIDSQAAETGNNKTRNQIMALSDALNWNDPSTPMGHNITARLAELGGLPPSALANNANPIAEAAMRVHQGRQAQGGRGGSPTGVATPQAAGGTGSAALGAAAEANPYGYMPALQSLVNSAGEGMMSMMFGQPSGPQQGPTEAPQQGPPEAPQKKSITRFLPYGGLIDFAQNNAPALQQYLQPASQPQLMYNRPDPSLSGTQPQLRSAEPQQFLPQYLGHQGPIAPGLTQPTAPQPKAPRPSSPEYLKFPNIDPQLLQMMMSGADPGLQEQMRLKSFLQAR